MGFIGPVRNGMIEQLGVDLDGKGNVATDDQYMTRSPACLLRAICAEDNRWWCGPFPRAARPLPALTDI